MTWLSKVFCSQGVIIIRPVTDYLSTRGFDKLFYFVLGWNSGARQVA